MMDAIIQKLFTIKVPGVPVPKGSGKAFINHKTGRAFVRQDNSERQKPWASMISYAAMNAMQGRQPSAGAVELRMVFHMPRPKAHFTKKGLRPNAPALHTSTPDCDKLQRLVSDSLTGIAYQDDKQVARMFAFKVYGNNGFSGVEIEASEVTE